MFYIDAALADKNSKKYIKMEDVGNSQFISHYIRVNEDTKVKIIHRKCITKSYNNFFNQYENIDLGIFDINKDTIIDMLYDSNSCSKLKRTLYIGINKVDSVKDGCIDDIYIIQFLKKTKYNKYTMKSNINEL